MVLPIILHCHILYVHTLPLKCTQLPASFMPEVVQLMLAYIKVRLVTLLYVVVVAYDQNAFHACRTLQLTTLLKCVNVLPAPTPLHFLQPPFSFVFLTLTYPPSLTHAYTHDHKHTLTPASLPQLFQTQHGSLHSEELAQLSNLTMEILLPLLVDAMQSPLPGTTSHAHALHPPHPRTQQPAPAPRMTLSTHTRNAAQLQAAEKQNGGVGALASASGLMAGVLRPVLKLACK